MGSMSLGVLSDLLNKFFSLVYDYIIEPVVDLLLEYIVMPVLEAVLNIIPKVIYLLYASIACIGDVFQLIMRKLAGLDVYYVDGEPVTGDIVTNFIAGIFGIKFDNNAPTYTALSTVFWSLVIFGVIICIFSTIFTIIKGQYNYDDKEAKGGPIQHIYTMIKTIINIFVVPLVVILGLYVSQAVLTALDQITNVETTDVEAMYGSAASELVSVTTSTGEKTYSYYDIFGYRNTVYSSASDLALIATTSSTFSGVMFKVAAYNANRLRTGDFTITESFTGNNSSSSLFSSATTADEMAELVDSAFMMNLHYSSAKAKDYSADVSQVFDKLFSGIIFFGNSDYISAFSKFDVGAVWYYYDLWQFQFIVGFVGIIIMMTVFTNIIFGLMQRIIMSIALFFVAPAAYGITPLDNGEMAKRWRGTFMQYVLGAYGAILGMNLMFMILPYLNDIEFTGVAFVDYLLQALFIIVGLMSIKALIATISQIVGGKDVHDSGAGLSKEVGSAIGKAVGIAATVATGGAAAVGAAQQFSQAKKQSGINNDAELATEETRAASDEANMNAAKTAAEQHEAQVQKYNTYKAQNEMMDEYNGQTGMLNELRAGGATGHAAKQAFMDRAREHGLDEAAADNLYRHIRDSSSDDQTAWQMRLGMDTSSGYAAAHNDFLASGAATIEDAINTEQTNAATQRTQQNTYQTSMDTRQKNIELYKGAQGKSKKANVDFAKNSALGMLKFVDPGTVREEITKPTQDIYDKRKKKRDDDAEAAQKARNTKLLEEINENLKKP